ncbi:hypothetical protein ACFWJY_40395 [Streptomyces anulatus]|uniref:hypothetical protein n=1 Tax=Streptomyces anulatus TaxID=1892 RepID=UPI0036638B72
MRPTAAASARTSRAIGVFLTACTAPEEPKLPNQAGNSYPQAYEAAEKAGYRLITAKVAGADIADDLGDEPSDLPDGYEPWSVCWPEATYVDVDDERDNFWAIDFYLVAEEADCANGRLAPKAPKKYEKLLKDANKAVEDKQREELENRGVDSEDSVSGEDGAPPSCYSPTWGKFSCDTGLPVPDERNPDGSYKYTVCDEGEEAFNPDCYP